MSSPRLWLFLFALLLTALGGYWLSGGLGPHELVFFEGDPSTREETGIVEPGQEGVAFDSSSGQRRAADREGKPSVLTEILMRIYLAPREPLESGDVYVSCGNTERDQEIFVQKSFTLKGSNELKVWVPRLPDSCRELDLAVFFVRRRTGISQETWTSRVRIHAPREGDPWIAPELILKKQAKRLICSGIVVDADGMPLGGSRVQVLPEFGQHASKKDRETNYPLDGINSLETRADGGFEVRDVLDTKAKTYCLKTYLEGYGLVTWSGVHAGSSNLLVRLQRTASLAGAVSFRTGVNPGWLSITLVPEEKTEWPRRIYTKPVTGQRARTRHPVEFTVFDVPPGRYDFGICYLTPDYPLIRVQGIEIHANQQERDVRLQNLDLRKLVKILYLKVVDDSGAVHANARMRIRVGKGEPQSRSKLVRTDASGKVRLTIPSSGVEMTMEVPGYQLVRIAKARQNLTIQLEKSVKAGKR